MKQASNKPFSVLKKLIEEGKLHVAEESTSNDSPPRTPVEPAELGNGTQAPDEIVFQAAMKDVKPLGWSNAPPPLTPAIRLENNDDTELEALRLLEEFVCRQSEGQPDFDPIITGEYVEKHVQPIGQWLLKDLRSGRFSVQTQLDLHGLNLPEAQRAVESFIMDSVNAGFGCVRIIHGRGWHSKRLPVLKERVQKWLSSRRLSRYVIAFTSARLCDGGAGALYVLLRRSG